MDKRQTLQTMFVTKVKFPKSKHKNKGELRTHGTQCLFTLMIITPDKGQRSTIHATSLFRNSNMRVA